MPIKLQKKAKAAPTVTVQPALHFPWRYELRFPWSPLVRKLADEIKRYPGYAWDPKQSCWTVSADTWEIYLQDVFRNHGYVVDLQACGNMVDTRLAAFAALPGAEALLPHQRQGVLQALEKGVSLLAFETGLGKTLAAITIARCSALAPVIYFAAPAKGIPGLKDEFARWWPECQIRERNIGCNLSWDESRPVVVFHSWASLHKHTKHPAYDVLVFDEVEYGKNPKSRRGQAVRDVRLANASAVTVGLSATPCPQGIHDYWNVYSFLLPQNWGSYWKFGLHYGEAEESEHGKKLIGIDEERADELAARLGYWTLHQSKEGMPVPKIVSRQHILPSNLPPINNLGELTSKDIDAYLAKYAFDKVSRSWDALCKLLDTNDAHHVVLTWKHETAQRIAKRLARTRDDVHIITGEMPIPKRMRYIDEISETPSSVIVASMECIAESINTLVFASNILLVELHHKTRVYSQVLGRFCRLNSLHKVVNVTFLLIEGTIEIDIAGSIANLISHNSQLIGQGVTDSALLQGLERSESAQEWAQRLGSMEAWHLSADDLDSLDDGW